MNERQQQKKHKSDLEEEKSHNPRPEGNFRGNRGGRGGRGGKFGDRPNTENEGLKFAKKGEGEHAENGDNQDGNRRNQDRRGHKQPEDKNSYYYKYFYEQRPRPEKVQVTLETEIPVQVPKDQRKKEPSKKDFEQKMHEIDDTIQSLRQKIEQLKNDKKSVREGGKVGNSNMTVRDVLNKQLDENRALGAEKKALYDKQNQINAKLEELEKQKQEAKKNTNKHYKNAEEVKKAIQDNEKRYETTSLSKEQERQVLKEIDFLKKSLQFVEVLEKIEPQIEVARNKRKELGAKIGEIKQQQKDKQTEIESIRGEINEQTEHKEEIKQKLDKLDADIQKHYDQLHATFDKKTETKEEYYKGKLEYETEQNTIRHIDRMTKDKQWLIDQKEHKARKIEERKQNLLNRPHPYQREIDTCEHLIALCQKWQVNMGLVHVQDEAKIKEEQKAIKNDLAKEDVSKKLQDGKIERAKTKEEKEKEELLVVGGGKKKGKRQKRQKDQEVKEAFNIDISIINKFGFLKVSPPLGPGDLEGKIQEMTKKRDEFQVEGQKMLDDEEQKLGDMNEENYEEAEYEEKDRENKGKNYRGKNGRGFDDYHKREGRRERKEFEGEAEEEDDDYYKPTQKAKGGKRGKEDLSLNDDNFPTL